MLVIPGYVGLPWDAKVKPVRYDLAYQRLCKALASLAPEAERLGGTVMIENIWNMFLLQPAGNAGPDRRSAQLAVGVLFDTGNIIPFGFPEQWIRILGSRIREVHLKDYRRAVGTVVGVRLLLEGDVDWPEVMAALGGGRLRRLPHGRVFPVPAPRRRRAGARVGGDGPNHEPVLSCADHTHQHEAPGKWSSLPSLKPTKAKRIAIQTASRAAMDFWQSLRGTALRPLLEAMTRCRIRPDDLTALSAAAGLAFCPLYFWSKPLAFAAIALHVVLDGLDGPLARHTKTASRRGSLADSAADQLVVVASTSHSDVNSYGRHPAGKHLHGRLHRGDHVRHDPQRVVDTLLVADSTSFVVYGWFLLETYCFPGTIDYVLWFFNALLALKAVTGFVKIRRKHLVPVSTEEVSCPDRVLLSPLPVFGGEGGVRGGGVRRISPSPYPLPRPKAAGGEGTESGDCRGERRRLSTALAQRIHGRAQGLRNSRPQKDVGGIPSDIYRAARTEQTRG